MQYMLREQNIGKSASRFGLVVGIHVILGAALIAGLNRVPNVSKEPPPISLINADRKMDRLPEQKPQSVSATLASAKAIVVPPVDIEIEKSSAIDTTSPNLEPKQLLDFGSESTSDAATAKGSSESLSTPAVLGIACPNAALVQGNMRYPTQAIRDGIEGDVTARFVVGASGEIKSISIIESSNRVFNNVVTHAIQQFGCRGQGQDVVVEAPFTFRLK